MHVCIAIPIRSQSPAWLVVLPAYPLSDVLVDLCEFGLQVLQQPVQELWNSPLLLGQPSLQHIQTAGQGPRETRGETTREERRLFEPLGTCFAIYKWIFLVTL